MKKGGLRVRLTALMLLAFLPFIWVISHQAGKQRLQDEEELKESALRVGKLVKANRMQYLESTRTMLMTLAQTQGVRNPAQYDCRPLVTRLRDTIPTASNIGVCDMSGRVFCSALPVSPSVNLSTRQAVQRAWKSGDMGVGNVRGGQGDGTGRTLLFAYPVRDEAGELAGAVFLSMDLLQVSWLRNVEYALPDDSAISILDAEGHYVLHSDEAEERIGQLSENKSLIKALPEGKEEGLFSVTRGEKSFVSVIEKLGPLPDGTVFYVNVEINMAVIDAVVTQRWKEELAMIALIAAFASGVAWFFGSRWIVKPARHLVAVAREFSKGNLNARSQPDEGGVEFLEIGAAFNQMSERLSRRISDLDRTRHELENIRSELEERVFERTEELQHSQARLIDAIENIDAGFAMFDANGIMQAHNRRYKEIFGRETAPLVQKGRSYKELLRFYIDKGGTIDGRPPSEEWLLDRYRYFQRGEGGPVEERLPNQWVRVSIHRMRDGGRVVLITDITTLKKAQESLLLRNRAIAALNSGVLVTDPRQPDNPIIDCNPAFTRISGYEKEEVFGKNCRFLQGPDTDQEVVSQLREAIGAEKEIQVVVQNYRKDGTRFWNELKISPIRDEQGTLIHFVGVLTDVTEREKTTAALRQAASELQRSNRELEEFAYIASHDLQEPLRMVASYTQLLARRYREKLDDDARDFIEHAVNGARRMQEFIEDLLKYSRVGTVKRPFEEIDLNVLVRDELEDFRLTMDEVGGEVEVGNLPRLHGDKVQLWQLFQNLISNAVKFRSQERPLRIKIAARPLNGLWEFSVRDNGLGFDQGDVGRIFEIFQRLKSGKQAKGTGMGLVICKKIVERHGGTIWAEGSTGEGAAFFFTLAKAPPSPTLGGGVLPV